jgi:large subunit ribosomal protein L10
LAISRKKKEELVAEYVDSFTRSRAVFFTDYRGLTVAQLQKLRGRIREADGGYAVVKNTLAARALEKAGLPIPEELLVGPLAVSFAFGEVPPLAKVLTDVAKETEILHVKGGILDGQLLSAAEVKAVADLPPREVVMAQLLGLIQQPGSRLAAVVNAAGTKLAATIKAYADKLETSEAAA